MNTMYLNWVSYERIGDFVIKIRIPDNTYSVHSYDWAHCAATRTLGVCYFGLNVREPRTKVMWVMVVCVEFQHVGIAFINIITSDCPCWNFRTLFYCCLGTPRLCLYNTMYRFFTNKKKQQRFELLFRFEVFIQR